MTISTPARMTSRQPKVNDVEMRAQRDEALQVALFEASDIASLFAAVRTVITANISVASAGRCAFADIFEKVELRFYDGACADGAIGTMHLILSPKSGSVKEAAWLRPDDLLAGLPMFERPSMFSGESVVTADNKAIIFSYDIPGNRPVEGGEARFVLFELAIQQLQATKKAWATKRESMLQHAEARLVSERAPQANVIQEVEDLVERVSGLQAELKAAEIALRRARFGINALRHALGEQQTAEMKLAPPALLGQIQTLHQQLGLAPFEG